MGAMRMMFLNGFTAKDALSGIGHGVLKAAHTAYALLENIGSLALRSGSV
jgi:hypothetical protein